MSAVASRMLKGGMWLTASRALINALGFVSAIVLARLLAPDDFGLVALGTTILAIVTSVTDMSLTQALVQHRAPTDGHYHSAWTLGLIRGLLLAGLMVVGAGPLSRLYGEPRLVEILYAFAVFVFVNSLTNPRQIMLTRQMVFWQDFTINVVQKVVTVVVSITVAVIYKSFWAIVAGTLSGQIAGVVTSYALMPFRPRLTVRYFRELWSFSVWLTLSRAMNTINWRFDQLLIGHFLGRTALGYYSVGDNLAQMPTRETVGPLMQALFPAFSSLAHDKDKLRAAYQRSQALITAIALPIGIGFALISKPFVLATMGAKWQPAVPLIQALSGIFAIQTIGSLVQPLGMAVGSTRNLFVRDAQMFATRLPIIIAGMMLGGMAGLIYARVVTGLIATVVNMLIVRRLIACILVDQIAANGRSILAVTGMAAILASIQFRFPATALVPERLLLAQVAYLIVIGALSYVGIIAALWVLAGRPAGAETEVLRMGAPLFKRMTSRQGGREHA